MSSEVISNYEAGEFSEVFWDFYGLLRYDLLNRDETNCTDYTEGNGAGNAVIAENLLQRGAPAIARGSRATFFLRFLVISVGAGAHIFSGLKRKFCLTLKMSHDHADSGRSHTRE